MNERRIFETTELVIPPHASIGRIPARRQGNISLDFFELYDNKTVFCDVFLSQGKLVAVGPPMLNLRERFESANYAVDSQVISGPKLEELNRAHRAEFDYEGDGEVLSVQYHSEYSADLPIRSDENAIFEGKNVLVGMQRNNPLHWIRDWVDFYIQINGANGVILYDMMSTQYSSQDIVEALDDLPGLESLAIVEWPFKYGVPGVDVDGVPGVGLTGWDSDFCQYVAWEHARRRFLCAAKGVTVADTDELFLALDGRSIFEHASESEAGVLHFMRRIIEPAVDAEPTDGLENTYWDYKYYDPRLDITVTKWVADIQKAPDDAQLKIHSVSNVPMKFSEEIVAYDFRAMKLNWRNGSFSRILGDELVKLEYVEDAGLASAYKKMIYHPLSR